MRGVAARWRRQYEGTEYSTPDKIDIMRRLDALDPDTATADEVDAIIGNVMWTTQTCSLCDKPKRVVVVFGKEHRSATMCVDCMPELHDFIRSNK